MDEPIWQPYILSATLTPNPAIVGETVLLQVKVIDRFGGQQEEAWISGEIQSGEV